MIAHLNFEKDKFLNIIDNENYLYKVRFNSFIYEPDNVGKVFFILADKKANIHIAISCIDEPHFKSLFDFLVEEKGKQPEVNMKYTSFFGKLGNRVQRIAIQNFQFSESEKSDSLSYSPYSSLDSLKQLKGENYGYY